MVVNDIIWKREFAEKIARKHHVSTNEAEACLRTAAIIRKIARGHVAGEHVYAAYSHILTVDI